MIAKAELRYVRISPRKFRQIIPLIKGRNPEVAIQVLMGVKKNASGYAISLLKSALANAKRVQGVEASNLFISKMIANCGPSLKRFRAASMGRASEIVKRTSHILVELDEIKKPEVKDMKSVKATKKAEVKLKVKTKKAKVKGKS